MCEQYNWRVDAMEDVEKTPMLAGQSLPAGSLTHKVKHILRNPYGHSAEEIRDMQLKACDLLDRWEEAYLNMRKFAEDNGLDTVARG